DRTTISGNTVTANASNAIGGGIYEGGAATFTIRNSTISGNHVSTLSSSGFHACAGAGIEAEGGGTWTLNNVTITGNDVACTMGAVPRGAGIGVVDVETMTIRNSIVAGNDGAADCFTQNAETITSGGHLLVQGATGCRITAGTGDVSGQDPLLDALVGNGGPTETHALQNGSPALEAGDMAAPGSGGTACERLDQRGLCRPGGARCDIGAFEKDAFVCPDSATTTTTTTTTTLATTTTTTLAGECGPRAATFASIICRLERLTADVVAADDLGRLERGLEGAVNKALQKAREAQTRAQGGDAKKAKKSLRKAAARVRGFVHKVRSLSGRKVLPQGTRDAFVGAGKPIADDM